MENGGSKAHVQTLCLMELDTVWSHSNIPPSPTSPFSIYLICLSPPKQLKNWVIELNWTKELHHSLITVHDTWTIQVCLITYTEVMPNSPVKVWAVFLLTHMKRFSLSLIPCDLCRENANNYRFVMETGCSGEIDAKLLIHVSNDLIYACNVNRFIQK